MSDSKPVFIADTCVCGLSVVKSMWDSGCANEAVFMADYAVNPLGVKSDSAIAEVAGNWLAAAAELSDTLVIACNTLSIRYHQLLQSGNARPGLKQVVSMVDCFAAMVKVEADRLAGRKIMVIGTEFTAKQPLYADILAAALPGVAVSTIGATALERHIARSRLSGDRQEYLLTDGLGKALGDTDAAVLACTCFPMVRTELEALFPRVLFLDPGAYCADLLGQGGTSQDRKLSIRVTGDVISRARAVEFAKTYLGSGVID
jgi:glutamate racemase